MKAKRASSSALTLMHAAAPKATAVDVVNPLTRPRPFLVQTLRLRDRKPKS
jgi:hypothetical protein